jgi:hypothetical protein
MSRPDDPPIRTVTVEFLRKGPPHNQLLSPLTEYLGICGDSGAGTVRIPYEQAAFNAVLEDLRYVDFDEQDQAPRQRALRTLGRSVGEMLGSVPGFAGSLAEPDGGGSLLNLRIVTSASELALLPFELAKMPTTTGRSSNDWLALQAAAPVCVTRRSRFVPHCRAGWRQDKQPRILFVVGPGIPPDLVSEHRETLREALAPWEKAGLGSERPSNPCLVELGTTNTGRLATIETIQDELATGFTFVHVLAHGAESQEAEALTYGLYLAGSQERDGTGNAVVSDVVTGDRFASALSSLPRSAWPSMVLTATCYSDYQGDLLVPGGSFAQSLHEAGVPLVVASQFPLTTEGSVSLTKALYGDLLWGREPLPALSRTRARLHAQHRHAHDWASLVVYDGLPDDMPAQALACRYERAKFALQHAQRMQQGSEPLNARVPDELAERALNSLPDHGGYEREREGLMASHAKLMAERTYRDAVQAGETEMGRQLRVRARALLEQSRRRYHFAARGFLDPGNAKQLEANLHWVLTQAIALDRLLGDSGAELGWDRRLVNAFGRSAEEQAWVVAFQSATVEAQSGASGFWSHGSLAELWLLKLFEPIGKKAARRARRMAKHHVERLGQLADPGAPFPVFSTKRQFDRYSRVWTPEFREHLDLARLDEGEEERWARVRRTATELVEILSRFDSEPRS